MKCWITESSLARKLGVAHKTLADRVNSGKLKPDGLLINGGNVGVIFDASNERMAEIRAMFKTAETQPTTV